MPHKNHNQVPAEIHEQFDLFKKGNGRAFKYFYDFYHRPAYNYVLNLIHNNAVAEEIIDDVFVLLWDNRDRIKDANHLVNFLYLVSRRMAIAHLVSLKKQVESEAAWAIYQYEWATQFDEVEIAKDKILSLIFQHIGNLPPRQKEVFLLSFTQRMDVRSIAKKLGTSEKNVYKHLSRAYDYFTTVFPRNHLVLILLMSAWQ
ncbi:RNA polymerase sigma factor [Puia sp. P3]|uniref:RNA polymerase sigma factor n=1 Tax=Puia sp. P3 TaxID=3423952 RepID=UPI003D66483F